jgi:predicted nucleotidyltransferase
MLRNIEFIEQKENIALIEQYFDIISKKVKVCGALLFGSVARGKAKPFRSYESDIDLIVVIEDLSEDLEKRMLYKIEVENGTRSRIQAIWMTPRELNEHIEAKSEYILDAFEEGIILYDQKGSLEKERSALFNELNKKGVTKLKWGWSWNIKAGDVIEL